MDSYFARPNIIAVCPVRPWSQGSLQALGIAKVWSGKARLPNVERLWKDYRHPSSPSLSAEIGRDTTLSS
jgi:hypothetical protein